jgi:hypothetical protein
MLQTGERPGVAGPGPVNSQSLAGGGISASPNLPDGTANRAALRRLLQQIDLDEQVRRRSVQQAITEAEADHWRRRATDFDWARPRPDDFSGRATVDELAAADERCRMTALACRRKAALLEWEAGAPLVDPADLDAGWFE